MSEEQTPRKFYINKFLSDRFVERIKRGLIPWRRPWVGKVPLQNGISGHQYQGLNTFQLTLASIENDFRQPYWLTWNQIHKLGGEILPEQRRNGTMFVFYKDFPIKEAVQVEDAETGELVDQEVEARFTTSPNARILRSLAFRRTKPQSVSRKAKTETLHRQCWSCSNSRLSCLASRFPMKRLRHSTILVQTWW